MHLINSYGINSKNLKAVLNSDDEELLKKIKKTKSFNLFKVSYKAMSPNGLEILEDDFKKEISKNSPYFIKSNFAFGGALLCICHDLSSKLPYTQVVETGLIDYYLSVDFEIEKLEGNGSILLADENIPYNVIGEFPVIQLVAKQKLLELDERMKNISIRKKEIKILLNENENKSRAYQQIMGIKKNFRYCLENNLDMLNFCH